MARGDNEASPSESDPKKPDRKLLGVHPIKWVFALEYVLQGLANPFQGITYQPFFRHLRFDYALSEAATQNLFAKAYLAWSFKPLIGFLIDAYGKTRTLLIGLLSAGALGYLLTPLVDRTPLLFFGFMFLLSVTFAATDVAVDRATVVTGDEEAKATGRSRATTVGLNQAICWAAVYGSATVAALLGGYVAEHVAFDHLMLALAAVPLVVLGVVLLLPRDRAVSIPLKKSVAEFWQGLNTGPVLGVMLFFFIFHFQPALGPLWNNHLIENLGFSQTQIGFGDGANYGGLFVGVALFATKGIKWQERLGMRKIFRIYILAGIAINLTQYLLVEPWFSLVAGGLHQLLPFWSAETARVITLCSYNALLAVAISLVRMSTFSLVGAVIPVAAAGSLFAGFMSVNNLAYSFSYSSGAWLYEHGMQLSGLRWLQQALFDIGGGPSDELSISMLILIGSLAYLSSFLVVHVLPDRRASLASADSEDSYPGPERWAQLSPRVLRLVNRASLAIAVALLLLTMLGLGLDVIASTLLSFFCVALARKALLDWLLERGAAS